MALLTPGAFPDTAWCSQAWMEGSWIEGAGAAVLGGDSSLYYYWSKPKHSTKNRMILKNVKKFLEALTTT